MDRNRTAQTGEAAGPADDLVSRRAGALWAAAILLFSLATSLLLSSQKLFWEDELFEFYSDARPTLRAVIEGQRLYPFSLEPPAFHLLLHGMQRLPLRAEIATRLPSLAALLVIEVCLYWLVLRLTRRPGTALLAMVMPVLWAPFDYSAEARVYCLLTASYAVAYVCYLGVLRGRTERARWVAAGGMFASLSTGVLLHYYGVLLPLPFLGAEAVRLVRGRRAVWPAAVAAMASMAVFVANLPFLAGLKEVQRLYFDSGEARWDMVPYTYLWMVVRLTIYPIRKRGGMVSHALVAATLLSLLVLLWLVWRRRVREGRSELTNDVLRALSFGLLVPVANVTIGIYRAHAYSPRYSLPVVVPMMALIVVALDPLLARRRWLAPVAAAAIFLAGTVHNLRLTHGARVNGRDFLRVLTEPSAALAEGSATTADQHVYIQDLPGFLSAFRYAPTPLKDRIVNVQSVDREYAWAHYATASLFARSMRASTDLPVMTYEEWLEDRRPHLLVLYGTETEWIRKDLTAKHLRVTEIGPALDGVLFRVEPGSVAEDVPGGASGRP